MLDIVIVNWNSGNQLCELLKSVSLNASGIVESVVVVDNASHDDSLKYVEALANGYDLTLRIIKNKENNGFGAACNQGAKTCTSNYLLFLNPDTLLFQHSLRVAFEYMQHPDNQKVGVCGIQLVNESGEISRSCARFPTPLTFLLHSIGLANNKLFATYSLHMHEWDHVETREVDHVIGAFYLVRRALYDKLKGFDERFFVYLEDLDFSFRVRQEGYRSVFLASTNAMHVGGGTSNQVKAKRLFYALKSRVLYSFKHFNLWGALVVLFALLFIEPISRTVLGVMKLSIGRILETWHGYLKLYLWIPGWMIKKDIK